MKLRHLRIERFRGIKELDWYVDSPFVCLIGPGDSTKTTILDAIDFLLSPRWNMTFDDTDFYECNTDSPIIITATIGDLPVTLKSDAKYGLLARGWNEKEGLRDEPEEGDELVISIRLQIDASLEPAWTVFNEREPEGRPIGAKDREAFGCTRLGDFLDRHFAWGRGSILSRLTEAGDNLSGILASANRAARAAVTKKGEELDELRRAARKAKDAGERLGIAPRYDYQPSLDFKSGTIGESGLSLHDGNVPVRRSGLGSRRLLAMSMQNDAAKEHGAILIDEIEHGLEPHRIIRLLQVLRQELDSRSTRSVFLTTHSPIVVRELNANELSVVRSHEGVTKIIPIPKEIQPIIRKASEALLGRKIIVCEGKTEIGFCRCLDNFWGAKGPYSFGLRGIALADGEGASVPKVACALRGLGYEVAILCDSDNICPDKTEMELKGVGTFIWEGGVSIEQRIVLDLPWAGVAKLVGLASEEWGEQSVQDSIRHYLGKGIELPNCDPCVWNRETDEKGLRKAIGLASKKTVEGRNRKGWFKRVDLAEKMANIAIKYYDELGDKDLKKKIDGLREWAHGKA